MFKTLLNSTGIYDSLMKGGEIVAFRVYKFIQLVIQGQRLLGI